MPAWTCEEALAFRDRHGTSIDATAYIYIYIWDPWDASVPSNIGDRGDQLY